MKFKIYEFKTDMFGNILDSDSQNILAKIIIFEKEVIKTIAIHKGVLINNQSLDSDFRSAYNLNFLDKYNKAYKNGTILIDYTLHNGTKFTAYLKTNFIQRIYFKALFNVLPIQKISGGVRFVWEFIIFCITMIITWYVSRC